jgi:GMP synthase (glutamine-hydrolysing)
MFDVPDGAERLAETAVCRNQAFAMGSNVMGVQFHPEADVSAGSERWLIGHAAELAAARIDPRALRKDAECFGGALRDAGRAMFSEWLRGLKP